MNNSGDICPLWEKQTTCPRITMFIYFFSYFSRFRFVAQFLRLTSWWEVIKLLFLRKLGNYWIGHWTGHLLWKQLTNLRYLNFHSNVKLYGDKKTVVTFLSMLSLQVAKDGIIFTPKDHELHKIKWSLQGARQQDDVLTWRAWVSYAHSLTLLIFHSNSTMTLVLGFLHAYRLWPILNYAFFEA